MADTKISALTGALRQSATGTLSLASIPVTTSGDIAITGSYTID